VVVERARSPIDARSTGFATSIDRETLNAIPGPRYGPFDHLKAAPGISPTTPAGGTSLVSALGSGVDQNLYLLDGTNFSAPTNGVARTEPGVGFIQEVQVRALGTSAEFGSYQGAVINVITKSGSDALLFDASYYGQPSGLTSQPVRLSCSGCEQPESGYQRSRYRDFTSTLGGPVVRERLWFFLGHQYLRDYDSQPGTNPALPRTFEQNKSFAKLTWRLAPGWQLVQSVHFETWVNPEVATFSKPPEATQRLHASVPAITFGDLTHTAGNTVWEVRAGRFVYTQDTDPFTGDPSIANRVDQPGDRWSFAPQQIGQVKHVRTTAKATLSHYQRGLWRADHEWQVGAQFDRGEHQSLLMIPTGVREVFNAGTLVQRISQAPSNAGGRFVTASVFASDTLTLGRRVTANVGVRFDRSAAISQRLRALGADGRETGETIPGLGTLYTWNIVSPRVGMAVKLDADGDTMLRAAYGRFSQGVLTGEISPFHPGVTPTTTLEVRTGVPREDDPRLNLVRPDSRIRAPRTDEYSIGLDRQMGRSLMLAVAYVRKDGRNFIGWEDVAGEYRERSVETAGVALQVEDLVGDTKTRRFQLTNPPGYFLRYDGLLIAFEKRRSKGVHVSGSYTFSRAEGLQPSSGATAAGAQVGTVGAPPVTFARPINFGQDPNDLINARGRLPNDRPQMFRVMTSVDVRPLGVVLAAHLQHLSGKPWAATALIPVTQNSQQRVLLEPRGSRRLSSQTLLDLRVSRNVQLAGHTRVNLTLDVLNALNDAAEEGLATDNLLTAPFPRPNVFMIPRRVLLGAVFTLGR
jgi:hypothetical protein